MTHLTTTVSDKKPHLARLIFVVWLLTTVALKATHPDGEPGFWILTLPIAAVFGLVMMLPFIAMFVLVNIILRGRIGGTLFEQAMTRGLACFGLTAMVISFFWEFLTTNEILANRFWDSVLAMIVFPTIIGIVLCVVVGVVFGLSKLFS